jgi:hypothetical protein
MNESEGTKCSLIDLRTRLETLFEGVQIHYGVNGLEIKVIKTALGQSADKGHLATLESKTDTTARAGFLTLMAATGGLSVTGAFADSETLLAVLGTWTRSEIVKSHCCHSRIMVGLELGLSCCV